MMSYPNHSSRVRSTPKLGVLANGQDETDIDFANNNEILHQRAITASACFHRSEADLISALQEVENHKVHLHLGYSSLFQYAVSELGLSDNVAYSMITVMRKTREVPSLNEQIAAGRIPLGHAKRIAAVMNAENSEEWLEKASTLTQRQLEKEVVKVRPLSAVVERASYVTESRIRLEVGLSESQMLRLRRAQDLVCQSTAKTASIEDTLIVLTEFYLKHRDPVAKASRIIAKKGSEPTRYAQVKVLNDDQGDKRIAVSNQSKVDTDSGRINQSVRGRRHPFSSQHFEKNSVEESNHQETQDDFNNEILSTESNEYEGFMSTSLETSQGTSLETSQGTSLETSQGTSLETSQGASLETSQGASLETSQGTSLETSQGTSLETSQGVITPFKKDRISVLKPFKREPIPAHILHSVNLRDQRRCTYINVLGRPCGQSRWVEVHHLVPVSKGGKNTLGNLATLCSAHHKIVHKKTG